MQAKKSIKVRPFSVGASGLRHSKHKALSKTSNSHFKSQCLSKYNLYTKNQINKNHSVSNNSTQKVNNKKQNNTRSGRKKLMFPQIHQFKMKTDNSTLSCSTYKNNKMLLSGSKDMFKNQSHLSSVERNKSTVKRVKRPIGLLQKSQKQPLKLSSSNRKSCQLQKMLNRTRTVLDSYRQDKVNWEKERKRYEHKIDDLGVEIEFLKTKISLGISREDKLQNLYLF